MVGPSWRKHAAARKPSLLELFDIVIVVHRRRRRDRLRAAQRSGTLEAFGWRDGTLGARRYRGSGADFRVLPNRSALPTQQPARAGARGAQLRDLLLGQFTEHAARQRPHAQRTIADAMQSGHHQADRFAHLADLPEAALVDDQLDHDGVEAGIDAAHARRARDQALVEAHTGGQPAQLVAARLLGKAHAVHLLHTVARVHELVREIAVIGEQQQTAGVGIEAADRVQACTTRQELADGATALRVVERGDDADRFVDDVVDVLRTATDRLAVDRDPITRVLDLGSRLGDDVAVHRDTALRDEVVTLAPRTDATVGQVLVESHGHAGSSGVRVKRSTSSRCAGCSRSRASRDASSKSSYSNPGETRQPTNA